MQRVCGGFLRTSRVVLSKSNIFNYRHTFTTFPAPQVASLPTSIYAVAKNYRTENEKAQDQPQSPLLFAKSINSLVPFADPIDLRGRTDCHYELELALLIGRHLPAASNASHTTAELRSAVVGLGLALDLTLKQPQLALKRLGGPWEVAKAFDCSCPLSPFVVAPPLWFEHDREIRLAINGEVRQLQKTSEMIFSPVELLREITKHFTLLPGDVVLTGTPVKPRENAPLKPGDMLEASIDGIGLFRTRTLVLNSESS